MSDLHALLAVFDTWPQADDLQHANPAHGDGHTACQVMVTDDQAIALSRIAWLYPSDAAGLERAKADLPGIAWGDLGFFWGWEIEP